LARAPVADAQRVHLGPLEPELREELAPRGKSSLGHEVLLRVAHQGDAAAVVEAVEQHLDLDRREVLHLVDGHVPVAEHEAASAMPIAGWSFSRDTIAGVYSRRARGSDG